MRIAITGSSGLIGDVLAHSLKESGHDVVRIHRGEKETEQADWDGYTWIRGGLENSPFRGCEAVIHLSGASIGDRRWSIVRRSVLRSSRIDTTRFLVEHLNNLEEKPRRLLVASGVGFYGNRDDEELTENSGPGTGFLAGICGAWENQASQASISTAFLRFGVVFERKASAFKKLSLPFRLGVGGRLGSGTQWMPWIHLTDVVCSIEHLLTSDLEGPVNLVAPESVRNVDLVKILSSVIGLPALLPVPKFALRLLLGDAAEELLFASQRVKPLRLHEDGYVFSYPRVKEALREIMGHQK